MKHIPTTLLLLACLMMGCGRGDVKKTDDARGMDTLRIAVMPIASCSPLYDAVESGLADSLGLCLVLEEYNALMDIDTAVASDRCDLYWEDSLRMCRIREDSIRPVMVLPVPTRLTMVANRGKRIRRISDLKEHMVATIRWSAMDEWLEQLMDSAHFDETDVFKPQINDVRLRALMIDEGRLECGIVPQPMSDSLIAGGHVKLASKIVEGVGLYASARCMKDSVLMERIKRLKTVFER